jgi:hypothetical protein
MSHPDETVGSDLAPGCEDCGKTPRVAVFHSDAGYYIGTYCDCGPTRESRYYRTRELAEADLDAGTYDR